MPKRANVNDDMSALMAAIQGSIARYGEAARRVGAAHRHYREGLLLPCHTT